MTKHEKLIVLFVAVIVVTVIFAGLFSTDDRPVRCFEGFSYRVGSSGEMHLQTTGKHSTPVRCNS